MATITINGTLTNDQSEFAQTVDDNDVLIAYDAGTNTFSTPAGVLSTAFIGHLNTLFGVSSPLDTAPSDDLGDFADDVEAAKRGTDFITVDADGDVTNLFFSNPDGDPLEGEQVFLPDGVTELTTIGGDNIYLWSITDDFVIATTSDLRTADGIQGELVAAFYLKDESANHLSAGVEMVTFQPLFHPDPNDADDAIDWSDILNVSAASSQLFRFDDLPSGSNLFGMVGDASTALVVFGRDISLKNDGTYISNVTQTVKTSQAGPHATIGIGSQMFDPGDSAYFTFVNDPNMDFVGTNLGSTEADDADNIEYTGGTLEGDSAFVLIAQLQGSGVPSMSIETFNIAGAPQERAMISARGINEAGKDPDIIAVRVYDASGTLVETNGDTDNDGISISISASGVATVSGFGSDYKIEWDTDEDFDQVKITGVDPKFDIGGFGLTEGLTITESVGDSMFVEDDGPSAQVEEEVDPLVVDDSDIDTPSTDFVPVSALFSLIDFNLDGSGTVTLALRIISDNVASGLTDTLTGDPIRFTMDGADVIGYVDDIANGTKDPTDPIALRYHIDNQGTATDISDDEVILTQYRSVVHDNPLDHDEATEPALVTGGTVFIDLTVADADLDDETVSFDLSQISAVKDDGPTVTLDLAVGAEIIVDESIGENAGEDETSSLGSVTVAGAVLFSTSEDFGEDGEKGTNGSVYSLALSSEGADSSLDDTASGEDVLLYTDGDDIVGRTATGDDEVLRIAIDPTSGDVTVTLLRALVHGTSDHDEAASPLTIASGLVAAVRTVTDGDDDTDDDDADIGPIIKFEDDGPSIGPVDDGLVDFAIGASVTNSLNGDVGSDPNGSPYIITDFTAALTIAGIDLEGVLAADEQSVTYYEDTDGDLVFGNAGDTAFYELVLGQSGAGDYTFNVLVDPPQSEQLFRFDDLPSGSNLFGMVGDANTALLIFGRDISLKADGTYVSNATQTVKTSQAGLHATIGIGSQMFDPGDSAYFTFVNDPNTNFVGTNLGSTEADDADNIEYTGGTLEGDSAFLLIAQLQGNSVPSMSIEAFNIGSAVEDSPQGRAMISARGQNDPDVDAPSIIAVRVYDADDNLVETNGDTDNDGITISITGGVATVSGFGTNYKIEWDTDHNFDQVKITGVDPKFDIGGFGFSQGQDTPDQLLEFTARVTDGDGDTDDSNTWQIGIDGTGVSDDDAVTGVDATLTTLSLLGLPDFESNHIDFFV